MVLAHAPMNCFYIPSTIYRFLWCPMLTMEGIKISYALLFSFLFFPLFFNYNYLPKILNNTDIFMCKPYTQQNVTYWVQWLPLCQCSHCSLVPDIIKTTEQWMQRTPGVKIRRALEPMACKIECGPSKITLGRPARPTDFEVTIILFWVPSVKKGKLLNLGPWKLCGSSKNWQKGKGP